MEKYSNLFLYIKKYFLKLCGWIDGCVCWGGGGVYEQVNKGINYQVCNTTQRCIYKLIN